MPWSPEVVSEVDGGAGGGAAEAAGGRRLCAGLRHAFRGPRTLSPAWASSSLRSSLKCRFVTALARR